MVSKLPARMVLPAPLNAQGGATYTVQVGDAAKLVILNGAAPSTVTVPANATAAFDIGSRVRLGNLGAGTVTITPAAGVTIRSIFPATLLQYQGGTLVKVGTDTWLWEAPGGGLLDPTTTKGDLLVRGASGVGRHPVGANGRMLVADSTQPLGVKWTPPPVLLLEAGQTAADVPAGTPVGTLIYRKA